MAIPKSESPKETIERCVLVHPMKITIYRNQMYYCREKLSSRDREEIEGLLGCVEKFWGQLVHFMENNEHTTDEDLRFYVVPAVYSGLHMIQIEKILEKYIVPPMDTKVACCHRDLLEKEIRRNGYGATAN